MDLFRKLTIFLLFFSCSLMAQGQEKCIAHKDVYFYITPNTGKVQKKRKGVKQYQIFTLLIDNQSEKSVRLENFSRLVFHMASPPKIKNAFRWEFLTLSNQIPDDIVSVFPYQPIDKLAPEAYETSEVVIPPDSIFISDIYIQAPIYVSYMGGCYYKLCLYYKELKNDYTDYKYVAETIMWFD